MGAREVQDPFMVVETVSAAELYLLAPITELVVAFIHGTGFVELWLSFLLVTLRLMYISRGALRDVERVGAIQMPVPVVEPDKVTGFGVYIGATIQSVFAVAVAGRDIELIRRRG